MENTNADTAKPQFDFVQDFEDAKKFVADIGARIPRSAIFWGIGAAVLGATAVAAVMYRNRQAASVGQPFADEAGRAPLKSTARPARSEADPDFADTSFGRQPSTSIADTNFSPGTHH